MTNGGNDLNVQEKMNEPASVGSLSDPAVAETTGGMSIERLNYEYDRNDGFGYSKYKVSYSGEAARTAAAAALDYLRPGAGALLPEWDYFSGTIGIGNYYDGKYHDAKIISGGMRVRNCPLQGSKARG